jgi:hypothetical protein
MNLRLFANRLRNVFTRRDPAPQRPKRPARLGIEALEDRTVPTIVFNPVFGSETYFGGHTSNFTVLNSPKVYLIFWGSYWGSTPRPRCRPTP